MDCDRRLYLSLSLYLAKNSAWRRGHRNHNQPCLDQQRRVIRGRFRPKCEYQLVSICACSRMATGLILDPLDAAPCRVEHWRSRRGLAHVQDKIETRCEAGRGFGYSHRQIAAE